MIKHSLRCFVVILFLACQAHAYATIVYKIMPGHLIVVSNPKDQVLTAGCIVNAVDSVVNSISVNVLRGSGVFNGTTLSPGQSLVQNIRNMQYIPITAHVGASATITNLGTYAIEAQCDLV